MYRPGDAEERQARAIRRELQLAEVKEEKEEEEEEKKASEEKYAIKNLPTTSLSFAVKRFTTGCAASRRHRSKYRTHKYKNCGARRGADYALLKSTSFANK